MILRRRGGTLTVLIFCLAVLVETLASQAQLAGRIIDENSAAVGSAKITLSGPDLASPLVATSDEAGRFALPLLPPGTYELRVEKPGYYAYVQSAFAVQEYPSPLEVVLNHEQEFEETVNVVYSAPVIDRQEPAAQTTLTSREIVDTPFSASHDFRNALPLIPGVIKDNAGRIHISGGGENQAYYSLDGFNITNPASGTLDNKISVDSIRAVRIETSRYSAEFGKGSAGVLALETMRGDDRFRFSATNFLPSYEFHGGLGISNWNPRATISGPIARGKAWFFNALDLQYDLNIVDALPADANTNSNWFGSNLTRLQLNPANNNILTASLLFNFQNSRHWGLSPLDPVETSRDRNERFYFISIKDQAYLKGGWVLETGVALNKINTGEHPQGRLTYRITPEGRSGNYFKTSRRRVERLQTLANILAPIRQWYGHHSLKFGIDANRIRYRQTANRRAYEINRAGGVRARTVSFSGNPHYGRDNWEFSAFVQDRWAVNDRILVDAGMRLDWDEVLKQPMESPRLAVTWTPARMPDAKFSAGIGVFHDALDMALLTRGLEQQRRDTFFADDGMTIIGRPIETRYVAVEHELKAPIYLNWSLGWEQKLKWGFYFRSNFVHKRGWHAWAYDHVAAPQDNAGDARVLLLRDMRRDRYQYLEWTLMRTFKEKYPWFFSYARSSARSSAVLDFTIENPVFGRQGGGPLDWDTPDRLITYGTLPAPYFDKYSIAYFLEWRTGLPYSAVNELQQLAGALNRNRFPDYFSLNLHVERRFRFWRWEWALRAGFNNLTGRENPTAVNNNIDSTEFGRFRGGQKRVFTGRIRFLGKS